MHTTLYAQGLDEHNAGHDDAFVAPFDAHVIVTVIHTTDDGTVSALKAACDLAKSLGIQIRLVATQEVPFRLALEEPLVSTNFLRQRRALLVFQAGIDPDEVTVQILLCRNEKRALTEFLTPRSLIAIGGNRQWWRPERRLEKYLTRLGHRVVFVEPLK